LKLYALSDLHLGHRQNRQALEALPFAYRNDWLLLGGDVGETEEHLGLALSAMTRRFAKVLWTPGNHELWTPPGKGGPALRGQAKYDRLVEICRSFGVLTPEDPYPLFQSEGGPAVLAPTFLLYDYSFRPDRVSADGAVAWAEGEGVVCTDEHLLHPDPWGSAPAWCAARCDYTEPRLEEAARRAPLVILNHFPLHEALIRFQLIPSFSIWCGTRRTRDWHTRFPVKAAVYGHLHVRGSDTIDGVRFEEVSFGYPRDWEPEDGMLGSLRQILPALPPRAPKLPDPEEILALMPWLRSKPAAR
jgi:3',5'-cyclic AMP phosphodiesterase CpdA